MTESQDFHKQIGAMISENQRLRVVTESQETTIGLLHQQYDALAASVDGTRDRFEREVHALRTDRDQAVRKYSDIKTLLLQIADLVMQALRADQGDDTPETIPSP